MADTQRGSTLTKPLTLEDGPEGMTIVYAQAKLDAANKTLQETGVSVVKLYKAMLKENTAESAEKYEREYRLYQRVARALVKPAVVGYASAISHVIMKGVGHNDSLLMQLLEIQDQAQQLGIDDASLISMADRVKVVEVVAKKALSSFKANQVTEALKQAVWAMTLSELFHCEDLEALNSLRAYVDREARKAAKLPLR